VWHTSTYTCPADRYTHTCSLDGDALAHRGRRTDGYACCDRYDNEHANLYRDANGDLYCDADHYRDANTQLDPNGHEHANDHTDAYLDPHADALACGSGAHLC
jgi:hypothetical protein